MADDKGNKIDPAAVGMHPDFPQNQLHIIEFKRVSENKTELMITEYDWSFGQIMEMSKKGMEQCLNKMASIFSRP
ncbi:hypothetical protein [Cytobacillus horneckiae]|uniref:hypothetical protein n=1 Tax=Cytobacillus horneckiae TaxID=549687 RepID=UPI0020421247|nr:hypothetical protein [Cytobacillus horneckiae]MCM3180848.1 hypothetical protein [Cytobacillus horneckiae]